MALTPVSELVTPVEPATVPTGPIVVCFDSSMPAHAALRWAAEYARLYSSAITVATRAKASPGVEGFADALATVRESAPGSALDVQRRRTVQDVKEFTEASNGVLVIPADAPNAINHALDARCPVAFVPPHAVPDGPVLLGAAASTGDSAIGWAFREAASRNTTLRAVRVWRDPALPMGLTTPEALAAADVAAQEAQAGLDLAVDCWAPYFPTVPVRKLLIADDPAAALAALTYRARLLVVGSATRGVPAAIRLGYSPLSGALRMTRCPVLVIPNDYAGQG